MSDARVAGKARLGSALALLGFAILIGLGVWQLYRLRWKEGLLAHVAALQTAPARPIGAALAGGDPDYTRVSLDCPGLPTRPFVELYGLKDGEAGWRLVSACPIDAGPYRSVLVDRGFIPDTVTARPTVDASSAAPFALVGVLRKPDRRTFVTPPDELANRRFYARDATAMAPLLGAAHPAPWVLMAETDTARGFRGLTPAPLPTDIPNRHLEYALTWFGLAATLAGVYLAGLWRRLRRAD